MRQYSLSDLRYISPAALRTWFQSSGETFAVVDVRDSDYVGGHIKGCYHFPSETFQQTLPALRAKLLENKVKNVVFHCALSQVRGPKCTLRFLRHLETLPAEEKPQWDSLNVFVLSGGFNAWQREFGKDRQVTEAYAPDLWD